MVPLVAKRNVSDPLRHSSSAIRIASMVPLVAKRNVSSTRISAARTSGFNGAARCQAECGREPPLRGPQLRASMVPLVAKRNVT